MNVYLMNEDGESFCIRARNMGTAVIACENKYLADMKEEKGGEYDKTKEKIYYHEQILQSCSLVGELKN